ncbi:PRD domain-containing protein [Paenalkalicoccus suaedae]|uniref:PRD domain-containing protein n=1 Tax=Paenalkalicoccus suaedae TaxID=2592382 RepID=A0A859FIB9_9BACI|nr:PRD domain-containing protein [Paenalkalicoccus suaedae]QKS71975.1 PRD domain-containing protein [Paenalkalicoccus suaedae]
MAESFTVEKVLNNNVVICQSEANQEVIFIGKGIGFGKKPQDAFTSTNYDKVYALINEAEQQQYQRLVTNESEEVLLIIHEVISFIHEEIGIPLREKTMFALTQHLVLALERTQDGAEIQNPFLTETKWLYYDTYLLAEEVVRQVSLKTGVTLPEAEVGFVTLHIQSARLEQEPEQQVDLSRFLNYIEEKSGQKLCRDSVSVRRLTQHLHLLAEFPFEQAVIDTNVDSLSFWLKENHPLCYTISRNVVRMMEKSKGITLAQGETVQLALTLISVVKSKA